MISRFNLVYEPDKFVPISTKRSRLVSPCSVQLQTIPLLAVRKYSIRFVTSIMELVLVSYWYNAVPNHINTQNTNAYKFSISSFSYSTFSFLFLTLKIILGFMNL